MISRYKDIKSYVIYAKNITNSIHFVIIQSPLRCSKQFSLPIWAQLESFSSESDKSGLLHSSSEHSHIGAQLSFLKELDKAKAIRSLNKRSFCVTDIMRPHCMRILEHEKHQVRQYPLSNEQTFSKKVYSSRDQHPEPKIRKM